MENDGDKERDGDRELRSSMNMLIKRHFAEFCDFLARIVRIL
jgi:hypothetical protein